MCTLMFISVSKVFYVKGFFSINDATVHSAGQHWLEIYHFKRKVGHIIFF